MRLQQGSLIVETSDGLFASDEVGKEKGPSEEEKAGALDRELGVNVHGFG